MRTQSWKSNCIFHLQPLTSECRHDLSTGITLVFLKGLEPIRLSEYNKSKWNINLYINDWKGHHRMENLQRFVIRTVVLSLHPFHHPSLATFAWALFFPPLGPLLCPQPSCFNSDLISLARASLFSVFCYFVWLFTLCSPLFILYAHFHMLINK